MFNRLAILGLALALPLAACDDEPDTDTTVIESPDVVTPEVDTDALEGAATDAGNTIEGAATDAANTVEDAATDAGNTIEGAADEAVSDVDAATDTL